LLAQAEGNATPATIWAANLLRLQRTVGNQAVTAMLGRAPAAGDVRLQRALRFSVLESARNVAPDAKPNRRKNWLVGLVQGEINRIFNGSDPDVWKKTNEDSAFRVDELMRQLRNPELDFNNPLTTANIAATNSLIHDLEVVVDKKKAAPRSIAGTLVGNEFTFVDGTLQGLNPVSPKKGEEQKDAVHRVMKGPYNDAAGRWFDAMSAKGIRPTQDKMSDEMRYLTYTFAAANYGVDWEYQVTPDQLCVEVITTKAKVSDVYAGPAGDLMDEYVFAIATAANLRADAVIGGGHINIDETSAFGREPIRAAKQLAVFMEEFYKGSDYWRSIDPDKTNAPLPSEMEKGSKVGKGKIQPTKAEDFEKVVREFRSTRGTTIAQLADKLMKDVFGVSLAGDGREAPKFQALNVKNLGAGQSDTGQRRIEIRRVPAQRDREHLIEHLQKVAELLEASRKA